MIQPPGKSEPRIAWIAAGACAAAGFVVFQFFGNATRGYVDTASTFWWWASQWIDPRAECSHGWIVVALSAWLLWRGVRRERGPDAMARGAGIEEAGAGRRESAGCRMPTAECTDLAKQGKAGGKEQGAGRDEVAECRMPSAEGNAVADPTIQGGKGEQAGPTAIPDADYAAGEERRGGNAVAASKAEVERVVPNTLPGAGKEDNEQTSDRPANDEGRSSIPIGKRVQDDTLDHQRSDSTFGIRHSAFLAMTAGLALHAVGFVAQQTRISIVALLIFTWGVLRLGGGPRWGRAALFPLGFLAFAIPINVLDSVGFWLRLWVIDAAGVLARVAHIDVVRSGTQLFAPDGHYQYDVAAACSGVRSLTALAALSLLLGYLRFRSAWRRGLMLLLCFPLTYLGNVARIGAIVLAAAAGGQRWGEVAHDVMGFGVFAIVLSGVLLAAHLLERLLPEPAAALSAGSTDPVKCHVIRDIPPGGGGSGCHTLYDNPGGAAEGGGAGSATGGTASSAASSAPDECHVLSDIPCERGRARWACAIAAAAVVVVAATEAAWLQHRSVAPATGGAGVNLTADGRDPVGLPAFIGTEWIGRRAEVTTVERAVLPADTGFSRRSYVSLEDRSHGVFVSIVLSGRDRTSIHRPELCLVGQGWTLSAPARHTFNIACKQAPTIGGGDRAFPATILHTAMVEPVTGRQIRALVAYAFVDTDGVVATHWDRFRRDAWSRLRHGRADRWAYVLLQTDADDGEAAALDRLQAVLAGTAPVFLRANVAGN